MSWWSMKDITTHNLVIEYMNELSRELVFGEEAKDCARIFAYDRGELVCERENEVEYLLFLIRGKAKVFTMLDNGKIYLLRIEGSISVYGDVEIMHGATYTANVEALDGCRCLAMPMRYIRSQYLEDPVFLKYMINSLAKRLDKISKMSTNNLLRPLKDRFAGYLMALAEAGESLVIIEASFIQVAEQLGTTYRHLSRTVREMEAEGLFARKGKQFYLINLEMLKGMAGDTYEY